MAEASTATYADRAAYRDQCCDLWTGAWAGLALDSWVDGGFDRLVARLAEFFGDFILVAHAVHALGCPGADFRYGRIDYWRAFLRSVERQNPHLAGSRGQRSLCF